MSDITNVPYQINLRGEQITLTDEEAKTIQRTLLEQNAARTRAEHAAAREAGQIWIAECVKYHRPYEVEWFSLGDAASFLDGVDEDGRAASKAIRCPDGTVYTRDDRGDLTWSDFVRTKAATS